MAATADRGDGNEGTPSGFRAQLSGAALADLVQLECYARSTRTVRVTSHHGIGYLYFRNGEIVHAVAGDEIGETAAFEILSWPEGTFEPCQLSSPAQPTIVLSHQALLLRAAHAHDEARHKLVSLPKPRAVPRPERAALHEVRSTTLPSAAPPTMPSKPPSPPSAAASVSQGAPHSGRDLVRLDRNGNVLSAQGNSEAIAAVAAYAARMGDLIGDALGVGALVAVEAELSLRRGSHGASSEHVFVHSEKSGNLVGLRTSNESDVSQVRERFGL